MQLLFLAIKVMLLDTVNVQCDIMYYLCIYNWYNKPYPRYDYKLYNLKYKK